MMSHNTELSLQDSMCLGVEDGEAVVIEGITQFVTVGNAPCSTLRSSFFKETDAIVHFYCHIKRVIIEFPR